MPLDPFFTSAQKDEFHEDKQRSRAVAKAGQFKRNTMYLKKSQHKLALKHIATAYSHEEMMFHKLKGGTALITGDQRHRSLTGFKPPKKVWDTPKNEDHQ